MKTMETYSYFVAAIALSAAVNASVLPEAEFRAPSNANRPETWFHLIGGNLMKEGMDADLDAIKGAGLSGIQLFHGEHGGAHVWPGVTNQIPCMSRKWEDFLKYTGEGCKKRGLTFMMHHCPGWSQCGGPWIAPSNAMRSLVIDRKDIEGGRHVSVEIPVCPQLARDRNRDHRDVCVLAFPTPVGDTAELFEKRPDESNDVGGVKRLVFRFAKPMRFRSVEIPSPLMMVGSHWAYNPGVSVRVNGGTPVEMPASSWQDNRPYTVAIDGDKESSEWVLEFSHKTSLSVPFVRFMTCARLQDWEGKAAWVLRDVMNDVQKPVAQEFCIKGDAVLDVSDKFKNGRLEWDAPAGRWTVLRVGHVNMCMVNCQAPREGRGWECDKLTTAGVDANFAAYIGRVAKGPLAGGLLGGFFADSWECECQTWSRTMEEDFRRMRGYDLRLMIPALFGWIIDSTEKTESFLLDWRKTIAELVEKNYHGRMEQLARENGMTVNFETSFCDIIPGDALAYWKHCDTPMCEFWIPRTEALFECKPITPCASFAHVYGKRRVAAETCPEGLTWWEDPKGAKQRINNALARGVTHLVLHTYTHNPRTDWLPPGTSFGSSIGTPFLRGQTWWKHMPEFTAWAARCGAMLEAGNPASDILLFIGEGWGHRPKEKSPFPLGYRHDFVNREVLLTRMSVKDGQFCTPEGSRWKVLWIPNAKWISKEVKAKLAEFEKCGGKVCYGSPAEAVAGIKPDVVVGPDSKGRKITDWRKNLDEEMVQWIHRRGDGADWYFVAANGYDKYEGEVTFRAKGTAEIWDPATGRRCAADVVRSDADTMTLRLSLASAESLFVVFDRSGRNQSVHEGMAGRVFNDARQAQTVSGWTISFPAGWGAPASLKLDKLVSWTELPIGDEGRHFSGTATYSATFNAKKGGSVVLDLGKVESIAVVRVNGKKVRTLWAAPYRCEVDGSLVKDGENRLEVDVTSTWYNRLVYDAGQPGEKRKTWTIHGPHRGARLLPCGLFGPVKVYADR